MLKNYSDPRRLIEKIQGSVIAEDKSAMSNLPQHGFQKNFPDAGYYRIPSILEQEVSFDKLTRRK